MKRLVIHFLNVGHGDCTFIELPSGRLMMALAALAGLATTLAGLTKFSQPLLSAVLTVSLAVFLIWWRVITPDWVRRVAESYAERLLEAIESL